MRLLLALLAALPLAAGEALPRIVPPAAGGSLPAITATGAWTAHRPAIASWLAAAGHEAADPGVEALAEMLARWVRESDGAVAIVPKYADIFIAGFNRYQEFRAAVEASRLPPAARRPWLRLAADRLVRERLAIDTGSWLAAIAAAPAGGTVVEGDAVAVAAGIRAALPGWDGLAPGERRRLMHAIAALNPGLEPDGWALLARAPAAEPGVVAVATPGEGGVLFERWRIDGATAVLVPPAQALTAAAPPWPAGGGADAPLTIVRSVLPAAWLKRYPLHLQLAFRSDGAFDNGAVMAPTLGNRVWAVLPPDPATQSGLQAPRLADGRLGGTVRMNLRTLTRAKSGVDAIVATLDLDAAGAGSAVLSLNGQAAGRVAAVARTAPPAAELAPTATWRTWLGTDLDAAGRAGGLVADLEDAALAWAAHDDLPDGRGPDTRGKAKTLPPGVPLSGTYATPVVGDGVVAIATYEPSGEAMAYGADDPEAQRINRIAADDVVTAYDPATGAVRWTRRFAGGLNWAGFNKGGPKLSAAVADGVVVAIGTTGVVRGLDAASGRQVWENDLGWRHRQLLAERSRLLAERSMLSTRNDFMIDPIVIGGVVLIGDSRRTKIDYRYEIESGMLAFDLRTGRRLWSRPELAPPNRFYQGAQGIVLEGRSWALVPHARGLALLDPASGATRWDSPEATLHQQGLGRLGDVVLAEEVQPADAAKGWAPGLVALRVSPTGATVAWRADPSLRRLAGNAIGRDGRFWLAVELPQRQLVALSAADGRIELALPLSLAGGEHCPFLVDAGDRLVMPSDRTAGLWLVTPDPAKPEPRYWPAELATGYCGSILPALADGRMFLRAPNRLLCYDLRAAAKPAREHAADWPRPAPPAVKGGAAEKDAD